MKKGLIIAAAAFAAHAGGWAMEMEGSVSEPSAQRAFTRGAILDAGYMGNFDFGTEGYGAFIMQSRMMSGGTVDGLSPSIGLIAFAAGDDYAAENDLPCSFFSPTLGLGYSRSMNDYFHVGADASFGLASSEYRHSTHRQFTIERRAEFLSSFTGFIGLNASPEKRSFFSGRILLNATNVGGSTITSFGLALGFGLRK